jgi:hypothetical protein
MLTDPLQFPIALPVGYVATSDFGAAVSDGIDLFTNDFSPGRTVRIGTLDDGTKVSLTIAHSQSNENAPFQTDRTQIRVDLSKINTTTGKPVRMSVYQITSRPVGDDFSETDAWNWVRNLGLFLVTGKASGGALVPMDDSLRRILAGEP